MSENLFNIVYNTETQIVNHEAFLYSKDSIGIEVDKVFPGCVIYIEKYSLCEKYWKLRAYCAHTGRRKYILTALHINPRKFTIEVDKLEICHKGSLARQLRRYERDQDIERLKTTLPRKLRAEKIKAADDDITKAGNNQQLQSVEVFWKLSRQVLRCHR